MTDTFAPAHEPRWRVALYWVAATLGILFLLLAIGALLSLFQHWDLPPQRVWALVCAAIGCVVLRISSRDPFRLWRREFRAPDPALEQLRHQAGGEAATSWAGKLIGVGLLAGGLAWLLTGWFWTMMVGLGFPVLSRFVRVTPSP